MQRTKEEEEMKKCDFDFEKMTEEEVEDLYDEIYSRKKVNKRKSLAPLFIYLILTEESSEDRHLSQDEIADRLRKMPYEIELERKAIGRIIHNLVDSGLGIYSLRGYGTWHSENGLL